MRTIQEIENLLESKIPREDVREREGGGGKVLSYIETWKAIDTANEIFGNLGWSSETTRLDLMEGTDKPTFIATVRVEVLLPNGEIVAREGTGYGNDKGKHNPYELAAKEAESDALKRALAKFGKRLGNALYDKTQEYVDDGHSNTNTNSQSTNTIAKNSKGDKKRPTKDLVKSAYEVLKQLQKVTAESFKKEYLNGAKLADLSDEQAESVLSKVKTTYPELGLN